MAKLTATQKREVIEVRGSNFKYFGNVLYEKYDKPTSMKTINMFKDYLKGRVLMKVTKVGNKHQLWVRR